MLLIDRIGTSEDGLIYLVSYRYVFRCLQCLESITVVAHNAHVPEHSSAEGLLPHMASFTNANGRGHSNLIHLDGGNQGGSHNCKCLKGPDLGHTHCRLEMGGQLRKEKLKNNI